MNIRIVQFLLFLELVQSFSFVLNAQFIGDDRVFFSVADVDKESYNKQKASRPRVIVTTDGEEDDRASMVRFLLYSNEFDVEGIINTSSQFHWVGGSGWNALHSVDWVREYIEYYASVYSNLIKHDANYPSPEFLLSKWKVGNINGVGEYQERSEGARFIAKILLDPTDKRPIWIQAWGGCNTLASALQIIQHDAPERMEEVASKMRLYLIWEQDKTYQEYIRPNWERYNIPTIISDQFDCIAYIWSKVLPDSIKSFLKEEWMLKHILKGHGTLCDVYSETKKCFHAEGDSPAFLHVIPNGLRSVENPGYGGWGGRYVRIRNNVWMDPKPEGDFSYPLEQWGFNNSWSKKMEHYTDSAQVAIRTRYFQPIWRWIPIIQNDFAARADWCVKAYSEANHHPVIRLKDTSMDMIVSPGDTIYLNSSDSYDPDGDELYFHWWVYSEAGSYKGKSSFSSCEKKTVYIVPEDACESDTIHIICEVSDSGYPSLTRYQRIILTIKPRSNVWE